MSKVDACIIGCHEQAMPLLVANWKMNGTRASVAAYAFAVNAALETASARLNAVFCPPAVYLADARGGLPANARLALGGQNCHHEMSGAFTGELSAPMLKDVDANYVILGHSERRALGETDEQVAAKAAAAIAAGLTPIVCIGESLAEYEAKNTEDILKRQLGSIEKLFSNLERHSREGGNPFQNARKNDDIDYGLRRSDDSLIIAYEPIWAIGSGKTPKSKEIEAAHIDIKSTLGSAITVLYGGSVQPANVSEILALEGVDGALIGGASLDSGSMKTLIEIADKVV